MKLSNEAQEKLFASLFPRVLSRAEKRRIQILEAAIACYATQGAENTSYESIGAKCKTSRTLIKHYFPDREELLKLVLLYIRADMQNSAIEAMRLARSPQTQFSSYIQSCFDWLRKKPTYWTVWMMFFYYTNVKTEFKKMHSELTEMGHERITEMLKLMEENSNASKKDIQLRAKTIQALITGALIAAHCENLELSYEGFVSQTIKDCLRIATSK